MKNIIVIIFCLITFSATAQPYVFDVKVEGKGQPIILIPGYSCSGDVWKETVAHLKVNYECHVLTLPGYAGVAPIDTPILATVKRDIIAYTKNNKLKNAILMGHSLGGFMSLWLAAGAPGLYSRVICVDGVPFISALQDSSVTATQMKASPFLQPDSVVKRFVNLPNEGFVEGTAKAMLYQVSDTQRARQIATWQYNSDRKTLGLTLVELSLTDIRDSIANIQVPVLMLGSVYQTKEISEKVLRQQFKNVKKLTLHIADSKHFIMYDQPEWFYNELDKFLK